VDAYAFRVHGNPCKRGDETLVEKTVQKSTGKTIQAKASELHGKTVSQGYVGKLVKIISVGECPKCHDIIVRGYPIDTAVCTCESAIEVALEPALVLPSRSYARLSKLAKMANVTVEKLVQVLLDTYIDELYAKGLVNLVKK
jgi:hypothetical protein